MADPTNSSTETADNPSDNERTLSDVDSDTLSDFDDSMSGQTHEHPKKELTRDVDLESEDEIVDEREANVKVIQNATPTLNEADNINKVSSTETNEVQNISGPSSYYPEIINYNIEQVSEGVEQNTQTTADNTVYTQWSQETRPRSRTKNNTTQLVLNKHTCVRKNPKRKPFNEKQISELEKEFQKARLSSPIRSSNEDFFELTPECDEYDLEEYQQQALSDENYVDLNGMILDSFPLEAEETKNTDTNNLKEREDLPPWLQLEYRDLPLQSYYGIGRFLSDNVIFQTESVLRNLDPKDEDVTDFQ